MQYFRNTPRRSSDVFPLCREDREDGGADSRRSPCGCESRRSENGVCHNENASSCNARDGEKRNGSCRMDRHEQSSCLTENKRETERRSGTCGCAGARREDMPSGCRQDSSPCTGAESEHTQSVCGCNNRYADRDSCTIAYDRMPESGCCEYPSSRREEGMCKWLAIATVRDHEFCEVNEPETALCRGTLFMQLDMPFHGQRRKM